MELWYTEFELLVQRSYRQLKLSTDNDDMQSLCSKLLHSGAVATIIILFSCLIAHAIKSLS